MRSARHSASAGRTLSGVIRSRSHQDNTGNSDVVVPCDDINGTDVVVYNGSKTALSHAMLSEKQIDSNVPPETCHWTFKATGIASSGYYRIVAGTWSWQFSRQELDSRHWHLQLSFSNTGGS